jgi:hypothetical protein
MSVMVTALVVTFVFQCGYQNEIDFCFGSAIFGPFPFHLRYHFRYNLNVKKISLFYVPTKDEIQQIVTWTSSPVSTTRVFIV